MTVSKRASQFLATCLLTSILGAAGCGGGASEQSFKPQEDAARAALEKALSTWKSGRAQPGEIDQKPKLQVADTDWASGKKLQAFEIGGMEDLGTSRKFQVKLTLEGAGAPIEATYIIVGKDPLWVFRDKDYPGAVM